MRISMRALALAPLCALAFLAAAPPPFGIDRGPVNAPSTKPSFAPKATVSAVPQVTASASPPPAPRSPQYAAPRRFSRTNVPGAPPDGTYVYELSRNGTTQGSTTVALFHRNERSAIETDESGSFGAAAETAEASFSYADFSTLDYTATYRAPFPRTFPLGRSDAARPHVAFDAPATVRYAFENGGVRASVDGVASSYVAPAAAPAAARHPAFVVDAPFMTTVLLLPGYRSRAHANDLTWYSLAFPQTSDGAVPIASSAIRRASAPPRFPKTPKNAVAIEMAGLATLWFDPNNGIVYEAHFDNLNVDARLASYSRSVEVAAFETPKPYAAAPKIVSRAALVPSGDAKLGAVLNLPDNATSAVPAVVLIPPGPAGDRNYDDAGPQPMYVDLAVALTQRGFAVLRYDPRGSGRNPRAQATWDDARADARAALAYAQTAQGIDPARVFALGYGNGADLALAASDPASGVRVAGVVALAPTTTRYDSCARKNGVDIAHPSAWQRSAFAHDPSKLAESANLSLFVLQPGVPACGETPAEITAYDDSLRAANPSATIVVADDLSQYFGGRYDADSRANTQMFFPYRFDTSTLGAIADWVAGPHDVVAAPARANETATPAPAARRTPPPPPGRNLPRSSPTPITVQPGVVLPSGSPLPGEPQTGPR